MSTLEELTAKHFAWFDNEIAKNYGDAPQEACLPLSLDERLILRQKTVTHSPLNNFIDISDVYYENSSISREFYLKAINAFCDIDCSFSMAIINKKKRLI